MKKPYLIFSGPIHTVQDQLNKSHEAGYKLHSIAPGTTAGMITAVVWLSDRVHWVGDQKVEET